MVTRMLIKEDKIHFHQKDLKVERSEEKINEKLEGEEEDDRPKKMEVQVNKVETGVKVGNKEKPSFWPNEWDFSQITITDLRGSGAEKVAIDKNDLKVELITPNLTESESKSVKSETKEESESLRELRCHLNVVNYELTITKLLESNVGESERKETEAKSDLKEAAAEAENARNSEMKTSEGFEQDETSFAENATEDFKLVKEDINGVKKRKGIDDERCVEEIKTVKKKIKTEKSPRNEKKRQTNKCGSCKGCNKDVEDCNTCRFCLDKPRLGGANTIRQKCLAKRCEEFKSGKKVKEEKIEIWVNVDEQIYFKVEAQPEVRLETGLENEKASDISVEIFVDLETIEEIGGDVDDLAETLPGIETTNVAIKIPDKIDADAESLAMLDRIETEKAGKMKAMDDIAETLPEIETKKAVVEIPDEIDADDESLAMLDWIEAEKAGKMEELGENVVKSKYVLEHGIDKKLKSILKKTSKAEPKITESMLRYILYGKKDPNAIGIDEENIAEDENSIDEEEDEDEEELRRSLEAEEYEDAVDAKEVEALDGICAKEVEAAPQLLVEKVQSRRPLRRRRRIA